MANAVVLELATEHPGLHQAMAKTPVWRDLLQPYQHQANGWLQRRVAPAKRMRSAQDAPDLIITGIARSGTSYLCSLMNKLPDCVVINEPTEIFAPLTGPHLPWGVAGLYRDLRSAVRDGKPITNKLHNGEFIEDTAVVDQVASYVAQIHRPDFLLATKNTLSYLARLSEIHKVMPHAVVVLCVRNPLDTIASWKTTFDHLANADVHRLPVGNPSDKHLSGAAIARLEDIARTPQLAVKRALLWRHFAELILEARERVLLVHYETLVTNPADTLQRILSSAAFNVGSNVEKLVKPSTVRTKRSALDAEDMQAIRDLCGPIAAHLGYPNL